MIFWITFILVLAILLLNAKRFRQLQMFVKTLPRDLCAINRFLRMTIRFILWSKRKESVAKVFTRLAEKHPDRIAFYFENEKWTYAEVEQLSNKVGNYFKSLGYTKGDTVALFFENRPEYVCFWLGLSKIGIVTALINTNLISDLLLHSLSVVNTKALLYGSVYAKAISDILNNITHLKLFEFSDREHVIPCSINLREEIKNQPSNVPDEIWNGVTQDKLIYIYTSGTTGLPKAAVINNSRFILSSSALYYLTNLSQKDVFYNPLPLYHSAGGMVAVGISLLFGVPVVIRKKFSASNYWTDCEKYNCTAANYIGELCRYLLAAHKPGTNIKHNLRFVCGNGLRPQIWKKFQQTFNINTIYEFYASTEGNCQLINIDGKEGAIGFVPRYADMILSLFLIRCNEDTGEPIRNKEGFCIKCKIGEPGLFIGKINQKLPHKEFVGYADEKATQKKILRDVLKKGDTYFNSGDIFVQDEYGYFYFRDRTGDTFRWKGENVATCEIEAVISNILNLNDAVVYGVPIPDTEGKAGMAAIVDQDQKLDLNSLARGLKSKLPNYAIPIFLRLMDELPMTGTFKLKKVDLQKEGFSIDKIKDRLYFFDLKLLEYVPLTMELYEDIICGHVKM